MVGWILGRNWRGLVVAGVLGMGVTGCASSGAEWRDRYLEVERDNQDLKGQLSDERSARATAVSQMEEAQARIGTLDMENETLRSQAAVAPAATSTPAGSGVADAIRDLQSRGLTAHETADGNIAIVLPSDINFSAGSRELTAAGRKALDEVARQLSGQFSGRTVRVEGHTDADPIRKSKFDDNWQLGSERARSVLQYLVDKHAVPGERLVMASRGSMQPVADNKSDAGKARNRRVEIVVLVPKDEAVAK